MEYMEYMEYLPPGRGNSLQQLNKPVNLDNVVPFGLDLLVWRK